MKTNILKLISIILLIIAILPTVSSFGVSSLYFSERPMEMYQGESRHTSFVIQNMVGDKDLKIKFELTNGHEIVTLQEDKEIYDVPFGSNDVNVNMQVSIPKNTPTGTTYTIGGKFTTVGDESEGAVTLGMGLIKSFDVIVIEKPTATKAVEEVKQPTAPSTTGNLFSTVVILLIIIAAIIFFIKRKK